ncbi:hypothetical protein [Martelella mangrovi]|uniref:Uncharacterized protein n=1 Tax=Martelella mangrovi TaxID=1397477 RepID=A0ABV2I871_9HYPH|nr:hypothetical protein [uncultured Martelella sp.]
MLTTKRVLKAISARSQSWKRGLYAIAALGMPALMAMAPTQAAAQNSLDTAPLVAVDPASDFFAEYLPFSGSGTNSFQDIFNHVVARDLMIGLMLAIAVAMVVGASYLWRENVNHLRADADSKKRKALDIF